MRISTLASSLAIASGIVSAHPEAFPGAPKVFGSPKMARELRARMAALERSNSAAGPAEMEKRQVGGTDGQCGPGIGSCATGYCCSGAGWCGLGTEYCAAPDCQFKYGSGCDANKVPSGTSTSGVARPKNGNVPYGGAGIYSCTTPGMVALTYDDGPYIYTSDILDILKRYNVPATFFITGNNLGKGPIDSTATWNAIIKRMYNEGHQIASHTWSHQDLSAIAAADRKNQMYYNEMALRNILGFFPAYMRPPFSSCTSGSGCEADMATLGYHVVYFDLDTEDYLNDSPSQIQTSKNDYTNALGSSSPANTAWLEIGHDIHEQTAHNLTEFMIQYGLQNGWKFGTVGQCLGDPVGNWYRGSAAPTSTTSTTSPGPSSTVSTDGTCGGTAGMTCQGSAFGNCCSQYGWCGSTTDHCGAGCQANYGTCTGGSGSGSISTDGTCGAANGKTCLGSAFGNCCSQYGWCGSTTGHCGTGCQASYGTCT